MNVAAEVHRNGQVFLIEEDKSDENEQCEQLSGNEADVSHENKQPSAAGKGNEQEINDGGQKDECHDFQGPYEPCVFHLFPSNCRVCPLGATSRKPVVPKLPSNKRPETGEAVEELSKNLPRFFVPLCMWSIFTCLFLLHVFSTAAPNQAYFCVWGG